MAKSKKDAFKSQLLKGSVKKELPNTEEIEAITRKVYNEPEPVVAKEKKIVQAEPIQRTTFDMPKSIHLKAKMEAMKDGVSMKEFVLSLVETELAKRGVL